MYFPIFLASLGFISFFIWYLAAENAATRRAAGLGAIVASLLTCGTALYPIDKTIRLGLDLQGGTEFLMEVQGNPTPAALDQAISVIRKRLDTLGTREISIQPEGTDRLKIQVPGLQGAEVDQMEKMLSQVAKLEFRLVPPNAREILASAEANGGKLPYQYALDYEILPELRKDAAGHDVMGQAVVEKKVQMSGKHVTHAWRSIEQTGQSLVELEFDDEGKAQFGALTSANVHNDMAIVLDNVVRTIATIQEPLTNGRCEISGGDMSAAECDELASVLMNPLETPIKMLSTSSVDASLGADQIKSGLHAGLIALLLVVAFMVLYYRVSGMISVLALTVNLVLLFGLLAQFHFTLTLPGIAGVVLTIGMAVDANVLIYERIRDELAAGKPARSAIDTGFEKAFSAIFDSNVTTLIPALVLAYFGTGPLRGFAVTLVLGIVANLYIVAESPEGLVLIDQHAAHERVMFEKVLDRMRRREVESQRLLLPATVELPPREADFLEAQLDSLQAIGVGISLFGARTFLVDALPPMVAHLNVPELVRNLVAELQEEGGETRKERRLSEEAVAKKACRLAVKANDRLSPAEGERLLADLLDCALPYTCPHGRPTMIQITRGELEKKFGRTG